MMRDDARPEDAALAALTSFRGALGRLNSAVCAKIAAAEYARPESARRRVGAYVHEITLADYGIKERPSYNAVFLSLFMAWYYTQPLVEFDSVMGCAVDGTAETSAVDAAMLIRLWGAPQMVSFMDCELRTPDGRRVYAGLLGATLGAEGRNLYVEFQGVLLGEGDLSSLFVGCVLLPPKARETTVDELSTDFVWLQRQEGECSVEILRVLLNRAFFALSDMPQVVEWRRGCAIPQVKKTRKHGTKVYAPEKPRRIRISLPPETSPEVRQALQGDGVRTVRAHLRRAHWHMFLVGSRAAEERTYVTKWLPPILVHSTEIKIEKS